MALCKLHTVAPRCADIQQSVIWRTKVPQHVLRHSPTSHALDDKEALAAARICFLDFDVVLPEAIADFPVQMFFMPQHTSAHVHTHCRRKLACQQRSSVDRVIQVHDHKL